MMADDIKSLTNALARDFLKIKNAQLGTSYKTIAAYVTDGGKMPSNSLTAQRRNLVFNSYSKDWNDRLKAYAIASGKIAPSYEKKIREMYPALAGYMNQSAEFTKIFRDAVTSEEPPTAELLRARLQGTKFWQTVTQSKAAWDTATDAERAAALQAKVNEVVAIGQSMGVSFSAQDQRIRQLATDAARLGWDEIQLRNSIGGMAVADSEENMMLRQGQLGRSVSVLLNEYGYPARGENRTAIIGDWVSKIARGQESVETFRTFLSSRAQQWYPSFANDFANGRTFQEVIDPYAQIAASTLEKPKESLDWTDPIYSRAINQGSDKNNAPMSLADWQKALRTEEAYGWNQTQQANDLAKQIGSTLVRAFGKVQ